MDEEKRARFVEWSCNVFVDVFWYFGVPRLWTLYYERGLSWEDAARRLIRCREKICHLEPPEHVILEFFRDFNRLKTGSDQYGKLKYSAFLTVTLCCVEKKLGSKVLKKTWGGSVPLPKHLRDIYIKYAARWVWHPIVSLPVLISFDQSEEGKGLGKMRVVPVNPPTLSCRAFQFRPESNDHLPGVRPVPPCSHCRDMFPSHDQPAGESDGVGYVQYALTPPDDASASWCRGNCAEIAAFGEMFKELKQKCRVFNGNAKKILAMYRMDKMSQAKLVT
uniref:Uncharacterized protein n=1 Tax=Branchiostoma floridae TaxID=7739 RepID=C3YYG2_BRAFL|eukprot:XP_002598590.1 hypothetical protein BRAFLDRAFT_66981 [Branchiostoma floridae]